ncbi:recombinase family protein [Culicoidibacter larvae]|uniref:Recombinase family protein n=1 Tax=Culicoidibacter larvae TaxID=2579976 RepID=A0A5R8QHZ6_9FIRM|nr:recombinase family protein [Culicoidibacter larvae]TLG77053.1 recombinase family protein [Culicoidibacter larvae]
MKKIAYMRVSTLAQKFCSQRQQLKKHGYDLLFKEKISSRTKERPQLNKALALLEPGDVFIVCKLDRVARSTKELLTILDFLNHKDVSFICINDNIDTTTVTGKFFYTIIGAFAEMEASIIRERICSGLQAAKENGVRLGRPKLTKKHQHALSLYQKQTLSVKEISKQSGLALSTVYKLIKSHNLS